MTEKIINLKKGSDLLISFLNKGGLRTARIKKHVLSSIVMRGIGIMLGFIQVPIVLHYLEATQYGIWVTIGSSIVLFNFLDIGLANGLRNKLAESKAKGNDELAREYVSLTYLLVSGIVFILYAVFLLLYPHINWLAILNGPENLRPTVNTLVFIVFTSFSLNFIFQIIRSIFTADQRPAYVDLIKLFCSASTLAGIAALSFTTEGSLIYVGLAFGALPLLVYIGFSIYFFRGRYRKYMPSFKNINFKHTKDLTSLGIKFFIIQISALILYSTDNLIITQIFGPSAVTPYAISYKYFSAILILFSLIATPYWSSFTDAYHKNDMQWIKNSIKNLRNIGLGLSFLVMVMIALSGFVYDLWIGDEILIPFSLSFFMGVNVIIMILTIPFVNFINGVGVIMLQLILGVIEAALNIPLSIFFAKNLGFGVTGIIMATALLNIIAFIVWPIQYKKIINNQAKGVWAK